jgi:2-methylisocitrate lyase-like PEP mutase family enzyme
MAEFWRLAVRHAGLGAFVMLNPRDAGTAGLQAGQGLKALATGSADQTTVGSRR